jgi:hypothetical protein
VRRWGEWASLAVSAAIAVVILLRLVEAVPQAVEAAAPTPPEKPVTERLVLPPPTSMTAVVLPPPPPMPDRAVAVEAEPPAAPSRDVTPMRPAREAVSPVEIESLERPESKGKKAPPEPPEPKLVAPMKPAPKLAAAPRPQPEIRASVVLDHPEPPVETAPVKIDPLAKSSERIDETEPEAEPAAVKTVAAGRAARAAVMSGRALLKLFEHGKGPRIDIAWPDSGREREALFETFIACYGMVVALIDRDGRLFVDAGRAREHWKINLDRFSGFVRKSGGTRTSGEARHKRDIRRRHPASAGADLIRVFPRPVDALLFGGLRELIGPDYVKTGSLQARYAASGHTVFVEDIVVDGVPLEGRVALAGAAKRSCR